MPVSNSLKRGRADFTRNLTVLSIAALFSAAMISRLLSSGPAHVFREHSLQPELVDLSVGSIGQDSLFKE